MKNYIAKLVFLSLLFTLFTANTGFMSSRGEYYKEAIDDSRVVILEDPAEEELVKGGYLLLLTSEIDSLQTHDYSTLLLICDSSFTVPSHFICNSSEVSGNIKMIDLSLENSTETTFVYETMYQGSKVIIIPENLLANPKSRHMAFTFLHKIFSAKQVISPSIYSELKENHLFEVALYGIVLLLVVVIVHAGIALLRELQKVNIDLQVGKVFSFLNNSRLYLLLTSFFFFMSYLLLSFRLLEKLRDFEVGMIVRHINSLLHLEVIQGSHLRLNLVLSVTLSAALLSLLFLLFLSFKDLIKTFYIIPMAKIPSIPSTRRALSSVIVLLALFAPLSLTVSPIPLILLSMLLIYLTYKQRAHKSFLKDAYSTTQKYKLLLLILLFGFFGILLNPVFDYLLGRPVSEALFNTREDFVLLPYTKEYAGNVVFADFELTPDYPIYVDDYLVFHPDFDVIHNKNVSSLDVEGNFIISLTEKKDYAEAFYTSNPFKEVLKVEKLSKAFYLSDVDTKQSYSLKFYINCTADPEKIYIKEFNQVDSEIKSKSSLVLYFPGCSETSSDASLVTYQVPFSVSEGDVPERLFMIEGIDEKSIDRIEVYENDFSKDVNFLNTEMLKGRVFEQKLNSNSEITAYSADINVSNSFSNVFGEPFNISQAINALKEQDVLENPATIWSSRFEDVLIRL
jgi:hypothetical protein